LSTSPIWGVGIQDVLADDRGDLIRREEAFVVLQQDQVEGADFTIRAKGHHDVGFAIHQCLVAQTGIHSLVSFKVKSP
jgi:hypothetical protein